MSFWIMELDIESSYIIQDYGIGQTIRLCHSGLWYWTVNLVISFSIMVLASRSSYIIQYYGIGQ